MKFIFPKNFNFKTKLFGVFDYSTIFLNVGWSILVLFFINLFFANINIKIFLFILFYFPFFLISIAGFNGENFVYVLTYFLKFLFKQKLYLYMK